MFDVLLGFIGVLILMAGIHNLSRRFLSRPRQSADHTEPPSGDVLDNAGGLATLGVIGLAFICWSLEVQP
jgi:hypothetical protein